jgi:hypothetical protein
MVDWAGREQRRSAVFARVVRFEGADRESLERTTDEIRQQGEEQGGPPPGVPSKRLLILNDAAGGKSLAISMFETEAEYEEGDRTLNEMSPPGDGMGQRVAVDKYEVAIEFAAEGAGP